jgi:hypothetical protein
VQQILTEKNSKKGEKHLNSEPGHSTQGNESLKIPIFTSEKAWQRRHIICVLPAVLLYRIF